MFKIIFNADFQIYTFTTLYNDYNAHFFKFLSEVWAAQLTIQSRVHKIAISGSLQQAWEIPVFSPSAWLNPPLTIQ
jgi:hypothetical protein